MSPAPRRTSAKAGAKATAAAKAKAAVKLDPLVAKGTPRRLTVALPEAALATAQGRQIEAQLDGATISRVSLTGLRSQRPGRGPAIKVRVDPFTPPGRYEGTATIGETTIPIVAEVGPTSTVRSDPPFVAVSPVAGETITVALTLTNLGNVPTDVPAESTFPLLDRSGFGDAFYHSIAEPPPEGKQRIDVLFDDLAESNGGLVTATAVKDPAGPIAPGESAVIQLTLTFSDRLKASAQYAGAWNIDATHIPVRVTVPPSQPPEEPS